MIKRLLLFATPLWIACGGAGSFNDTLGAAAVAGYSTQAFTAYSAALDQAKTLRTALGALVATPTQANLDAARAAWIAARPSYQQTEATRFFDSPIDGPPDGPEGRINAWPLDENYLDYTVGAPTGGLINDLTFTISKAALMSANTAGGDKNVATGYHAIEFLLWGQDLSTTGPGARPFTDYVVGTGTNADRRGQYLLAVADLLVDDLTTVANAWAPSQSGNYRATFNAASPRVSVTGILIGLGSLASGELAGQRMTVAYQTKDMEQEHSCFSDNTIADLTNDAVGLKSFYHSGVDALLVANDPTAAAALSADLDAAVAAVGAIPPPFDQAILGADTAPGRVSIKNAIDKVTAVAQGVATAATSLGLSVVIQ